MGRFYFFGKNVCRMILWYFELLRIILQYINLVHRTTDQIFTNVKQTCWDRRWSLIWSCAKVGIVIFIQNDLSVLITLIVLSNAIENDNVVECKRCSLGQTSIMQIVPNKLLNFSRCSFVFLWEVSMQNFVMLILRSMKERLFSRAIVYCFYKYLHIANTFENMFSRKFRIGTYFS